MGESCPERWQGSDRKYLPQVLFSLGVSQTSAEDVSLDSQVTSTSVIPAHQETWQAMSGNVFSCQNSGKRVLVYLARICQGCCQTSYNTQNGLLQQAIPGSSVSGITLEKT